MLISALAIQITNPHQTPRLTPATTTPAAKTTTTTTPAVAAANAKSGTIDSEVAGTYTCDQARSNEKSNDSCLPDETMKISDDFTKITISYTKSIGNPAVNCSLVLTENVDLSTVIIADDGTPTSNNTATMTAEFQPVVSNDTTPSAECLAAIKTITPNTKAKTTITLQVDQNKVTDGFDELHYTIPLPTGGTDLKFERVVDTTDQTTTKSADPASSNPVAGEYDVPAGGI